MQRFILNPVLHLACLLAVTACGEADGADESGDSRDDSFLAMGKADGAVSEGTPLATAVLALANEADFDTLDISVNSGGVGLDIRAAGGIVEHRAGPDGIEGTDDDDLFDTLAELDATPYVGSTAFSRLADYAESHGYLEPEPEPEVSEGTPIAEAVLALVNEADFDTLDRSVSSGGVGLDARAAGGIVEHRAGSDGADGTDDDDLFDTLAELDAIPYVGDIALSRLADYAQSHGDLEPESEACVPEVHLSSNHQVRAVSWSGNAYLDSFTQRIEVTATLRPDEDPTGTLRLIGPRWTQPEIVSTGFDELSRRILFSNSVVSGYGNASTLRAEISTWPEAYVAEHMDIYGYTWDLWGPSSREAQCRVSCGDVVVDEPCSTYDSYDAFLDNMGW